MRTFVFIITSCKRDTKPHIEMRKPEYGVQRALRRFSGQSAVFFFYSPD